MKIKKIVKCRNAQRFNKSLRVFLISMITVGLLGCSNGGEGKLPNTMSESGMPQDGAAENETSQEERQEAAERGRTLQDKRAQDEPDDFEGQEAEKTEAEAEIDTETDTEIDTETDTTVTMADMVGGNRSRQVQEETPELPDTVLWFNATYAPLTYSNGWNWRLVGGLEQTEDNIRLSKNLLRTSWSVQDRETALVTVDSLIRKGHRGKCRECMEELEEWGALELDEDDFIEELLDRDPEDDLGRYVIAYEMCRNGIEPEYIAAWDLCRVNQLYADYYLCGYMDYEEAMDASLENSLRLQGMYESWDEMVSAYMLGYQFWQGDLMITDNSPAAERYQYCDMLMGMQNGPYTLDWNMKLEKSW